MIHILHGAYLPTEASHCSFDPGIVAMLLDVIDRTCLVRLHVLVFGSNGGLTVGRTYVFAAKSQSDWFL